MAKRIALVRESALATVAGIEKYAVQAARRVVRLQERRRKLRRELKSIESELRLAKQQLRAITQQPLNDATLDTPLPAASDGKL